MRVGLAVLEGLAQVISLNQMGDRERGPIEPNEVESALELPVHGASRSSTSSVFSSNEEMSSDEEPGSSDEDTMEEITTFDESQSMSPVQELSPLPPSSTSPPETSTPELFSPRPPERTPPGTPLARTASHSQDISPSQSRFYGSRRSSRRMLSVVPEVKLGIGEKLKRCSMF